MVANEPKRKHASNEEVREYVRDMVLQLADMSAGIGDSRVATDLANAVMVRDGARRDGAFKRS